VLGAAPGATETAPVLDRGELELHWHRRVSGEW
jgi:hypothetical protein